jgi:bifunctional enzyme CysN/CysC
MDSAAVLDIPVDADVPADGADAGVVRFIACGSVDDGKSTLLGRLLLDCGAFTVDELHAAKAASQGAIDCPLLFDGLAAEREQGITIDVAYRQFSTPRRSFIVADTPGHEQYTRNMVTGASTADLAIVVVDARNGVLTQTRRHCCILALLGIRHVVFAVTKMDLAGFSQARFLRIESELCTLAARMNLEHAVTIPVCGITGEHIVRRGTTMPWYGGPTLLEALEAVSPRESRTVGDALRMPVQLAIRPHADFRGYAGTVVAGRVARGDAIRVLPSGQRATVDRILAGSRDVEEACVDEAIVLTLRENVDASRGDVLVADAYPPQVADRFEVAIAWLDAEPLLRGRSYLVKLGARTVAATVLPLKYRVQVETFEQVAAEVLQQNEIGVAEIETSRPLVFTPYAENRDLGGFILIDRISSRTMGAGMIRHALRRADNVRWQHVDVDQAARRRLSGHAAGTVWLTGLSGAGKSTIANAVERMLFDVGCRTYLLDGDNLRHGLNKDLGFTAADRVENIRRAAEVARILVDAGQIVLASLISPFRSERRMARELFPAGKFVEVHVDVPLAVAEARDPKGLYRKARAGSLANFTGIDSPYETPERPELRIDAASTAVEDAARAIVEHLRRNGWLEPA